MVGEIISLAHGNSGDVRNYDFASYYSSHDFCKYLHNFLPSVTSKSAVVKVIICFQFGQFFLGFVALVFPAFIEFFVDWEEQYASRAR